ncbi:MAG TPA: hypothetical protein VFZ66_16505 [Herpetosiphonaceae bacterium]
MPEERYTADEQALFDHEYRKKLDAELPSVREEEIKAAAQRAAELELEQQRDAISEQLDSEVADATVNSAREQRAEANREAPSKLVIGLVILLLLLFLLAINDRLPGFGRARGERTAATANNTGQSVLTPVLGGDGPQATPVGSAAQGSLQATAEQTGRGLPNVGADVVPTPGPTIDPNISQIFTPFYLAHDGLRVFGNSISPPLTVNGRQVQWFERTRLEHWPEYAGTPYEVQSALVGMEYTDGRDFPQQSFFTNRPGLWYFPETAHGVRGKFLDYWLAHGGLDVFGYPISDEVIEILPETKRYHTVQYFQRARLELHPEHAGTEDEVQVGLLGRAIYLNEEKSIPVPPLAPTPVPLP